MDLEVQVCKNCVYFINDGERCDGINVICFSNSPKCEEYEEDTKCKHIKLEQ